MESNEMEIPVEAHRDSVRGGTYGAVEPSIGELFKRLGTDTGTLIRAEATLAKAEARETAARLARDAAKVGVAAALALVGVIALSAFLIIGLGMLLGGAWWLSALIVGAVTLGIGAMLVGNAVRDLKTHSLGPQQTIETLKEDKDWAARQMKELKHDLTSDPTAPSTRR
jgi:uncharacterized membrane protein YqjE